jgi:hypothetical protein
MRRRLSYRDRVRNAEARWVGKRVGQYPEGPFARCTAVTCLGKPSGGGTMIYVLSLDDPTFKLGFKCYLPGRGGPIAEWTTSTIRNVYIAPD